MDELSTAEVGFSRSDFNGSIFTVSDSFWGAFIKMKNAKKQTDRYKAYKDITNRNLQLQNQNDIEAMLLQILQKKYSKQRETNHFLNQLADICLSFKRIVDYN